MAIKASDYVWHNGQLVPWDDAKIHVMAHVINYGSSVFEGIRCYQNGKGPAIFRLRDHMLRLLQSCKIYRIELDYGLDDLCQAAVDLVAANKVSPCYVRPIVLRGYARSASTRSTRPPRFTLPITSGASIWAALTATTVSTFAFPRGRAWRPTPCRPWPKPAPIT